MNARRLSSARNLNVRESERQELLKEIELKDNKYNELLKTLELKELDHNEIERQEFKRAGLERKESVDKELEESSEDKEDSWILVDDA